MCEFDWKLAITAGLGLLGNIVLLVGLWVSHRLVAKRDQANAEAALKRQIEDREEQRKLHRADAEAQIELQRAAQLSERGLKAIGKCVTSAMAFQISIAMWESGVLIRAKASKESDTKLYANAEAARSQGHDQTVINLREFNTNGVFLPPQLHGLRDNMSEVMRDSYVAASKVTEVTKDNDRVFDGLHSAFVNACSNHVKSSWETK